MFKKLLFLVTIIGAWNTVPTVFVHAQTSCYTYSPTSGSTQTIDIYPSSGKQTITIPNQNPPSILQTIMFNAANQSCAVPGIAYTQTLFDYFLADSQVLPFYGTPFTLYPADNDPNAVNMYLSYDLYNGLGDIGRDVSSATVAKEDAIIKEIDLRGRFSMRAKTNLGSVDLSAPATNCAKLSGDGPVKVVFSRTSDWNKGVSDLIVEAQNVINNGYKTIDPYKSNFNKFSFYLDLNKYDPSIIAGIKQSVSGRPSEYITSCGNGDTYVLFTNSTNYGPAFSYLGSGLSVYNFFGIANQDILNKIQNALDVSLNKDQVKAIVIMHEVAHAFSGVLDEYIIETTNNFDNIIFTTEANKINSKIVNTENCSTQPSRDFRSPIDDNMYGAHADLGCSYLVAKLQSGQKFPMPYYRASSRSIMKSGDAIRGIDPIFTPKFNVISCGYIIASINKEILSRENAAKYWPQCMNLDVTGKDEISVRTPKPVINSVSVDPSSTNTFNISGSGITPNGYIRLTPVTTSSAGLRSANEANSYKAFEAAKDAFKNIFEIIVPVAHGQTAGYDITYSSSTGSSITFKVPEFVADGTYRVSVSNENSPWNDTSYTITVSGHGEGNTSVNTIPVDTTPTTPTTPTVTSSTSIIYSCSTGYVLQSDNTCYKAPTNATLGYVCNSGDTFGYEISTNAPTCVNSSGFGSYTPTQAYSCPSGATLSGTQCTYPKVSAAKSCTTGYTLNSTKTACVQSSAGGVTCPSGYALQANNTCITTSEAVYITSGVYTGNYKCPTTEYVIGGETSTINVFNEGGTCVKTVNASGIITVSSTNVATTSISISWTDAMNKSPYTIRTAVGGTVIATVSNKEYTQIGLVPGANYCYVVYDSTGSNYSNKLCKNTISISVGTPVLSASVPIKGAVSLSWTKVDDGSGSYMIERSLGTTNTFTTITTIPAGTTSYIDTTVAPATSYSYKIMYKHVSGTNRTSAIVSVKTLAKPVTPVLKVSTVRSDAIDLTWTDTDGAMVTGYTLVQTSPVKTTIFPNTLTTTYTVSGLNPVQKYCFALSALIYEQRSATSSAVCGTTLKAATVVTVPPTTVTSTTTTTTQTPIATTTTPTQISTTTQTPPTVIPTTTSIPATVTYTCTTGTLSGTSCTATTFTTNSVQADKSTVCYAPYTKISSTLCKDKVTLATTTTTVVYTCGSARTLNPADNRCYTTTITTTPAVPNYSCPNGYTLNATDHTCTLTVGVNSPNNFATSTTTASVWDAIKDWFIFNFLQ